MPFANSSKKHSETNRANGDNMGAFGDLGRPDSRLNFYVKLILSALLVTMPLLLGSTVTRPTPLFIQQSLLALVVITWGVVLTIENRRIPVHISILLPLALALIGYLQAVPLPPSIIESLAPASAHWYHVSLDSLFLYGQGQWKPISPAVTQTIATANWIALAGCAALIASFLFARRRSYKKLTILIGCTTFFMAMLGVGHMAAHEQNILGIFQSSPVATFFHSTFVNPNNAGAYLGLGSLLLLGLALHEKRRQHRLMYAAMSGICGIGVMLTLSRGSIIVFILALLALAGIVIKGYKAKIATAVFAFAVIIASSYLAADPLFKELASFSTPAQISAKINTWIGAFHVVKAAPLTGMGLGSFSSIIHLYQTTAAGLSRAIFPENIILQMFVEIGIPLGSLVLIALIVVLLTLIRRTQPSRMMVACSLGLLYVLVHDFADFALLVPSIFFTWIILTAALTGRLFRRSNMRKRLHLVPGRILGGAFIAVGLMHFTLGSWAFANNPYAVQKRMHTLATDKGISEKDFEEKANKLIDLYPTDYYLRLLASEHYRLQGWSGAAKRIMHLEKGASLNSVSPLPRRLLGQAYADIGNKEKSRKQFYEGLRYAFKDVRLIEIAIESGFHKAELAELFPRNLEVARYSTRILKRLGEEEAAAILYEEALTAKAEAKDLKVSACALARMGESVRAKNILSRLKKEYPGSVEPWKVEAALLVSEGKYSKALEAYEKAIKENESDNLLLLKAADIALKADNPKKTKAFLDRVKASDNKLLGSFFYIRGQLNMHQRHYNAAYKDFKLASAHEPNSCGYLQSMAKALEVSKRNKEAIRSYKKAAKCFGGSKGKKLFKKAKKLENE